VNSDVPQSWLSYTIATHPLTRRVYRLEALGYSLILLAVLIGLWQVLQLIPAIYDSRAQLVGEQMAAVRSVEARALEPIHGSLYRDGITGRVEWVDSGISKAAVATVRSPASTGEVVEIWLDHYGAIAEPPATYGEARGYTGGISFSLIMAILTAGAAASAAVRYGCVRTRGREWDRALRDLCRDDDGESR
jgi:hypothetical protein